MPLLMRAPWEHASIGRIARGLAELVDVYPTVVELAGVTPDESELPPSVRKDLSTYIHLIRQALRSGHSERIGAIVRAAFFSTSSW